MLDALRDVIINLIASAIFASVVHYFQKSRKPAEAGYRPPAPVDHRPAPAGRSPASTGPDAGKWGLDLASFAWLAGLSITFVAPFLLGAITLAVIDETSGNQSPFITDQMRASGDLGYVQYWLGFSILAIIEIAILLLRPWRGRVFGVSLGIALAVFLVIFGIPASRGGSLFGG